MVATGRRLREATTRSQPAILLMPTHEPRHDDRLHLLRDKGSLAAQVYPKDAPVLAGSARQVPHRRRARTRRRRVATRVTITGTGTGSYVQPSNFSMLGRPVQSRALVNGHYCWSSYIKLGWGIWFCRNIRIRCKNIFFWKAQPFHQTNSWKIS